MDLTKILEQWAATAPSAAIIGIVVWLTLRDHGRILRSMDMRLAKMLERTRTTPPLGVPHGRRERERSRHDSDDVPSIPRTTSEDDIHG